MSNETEFHDHRITLEFNVPSGDSEGVLTEALFEAALENAPSEAAGMVASADTNKGKVWVAFTLPHSSREFADSVCAEMKPRIKDAVLSNDETCVTP